MVPIWKIRLVQRTSNGTLHMPQVINPQNKSITNIRHSRVPPKQFNMPKMSYTDLTIVSAQDLVYALHNPAPERPLVKLRNAYTEALRYL